ncbi:esterase FE4-like isoform X2 [Leguminivora glycinivorella]|uniref:esterase FE4-like isoform X2 n=1 Tax=Leguminivora glycinivorella TaxID=1035111 RepID=UPI00200E4448|nr:esterase FE4-like isoform X2 [Leguminivora glycinivorella]
MYPQHKRIEPVVTVKQGKLQGGTDTLYDGSTYYSFRGIPYAQPPLGQLRFRAPLPPQPWTGIRKATEYGSSCAQTEDGADSVFQGSEDCLFLNVFTKSLHGRTPVMVFIHGGSYLSGSGDDELYGPKFIVQQDVVLVTLNYRLEVLGFLSLETPEVPGNAGMKDQVAALKWVKENIAKFGGDPDNITIFGESSGACSVTHHILSPMTTGLFHKVIAQSGTSVHDWAIGEDSKSRAFRVGNYLGKNTKNTTELLDFLMSLPAAHLTKLTAATSTEDEKYRGLPERFLPVVEKKFNNVEAFLNENPLDILQSKTVRKVPLILGFNSAEAIIMIEDRLGKLDIYNNNPSYDVPREIAEKISEEKMNDMGKRIRKFYIGDREYTKNDYKEIVSMLSDVHFVYDTHRFTHLYSKHNSPIYMYRFSFESDLNVFKNASTMGLDLKGACHADELFYMFTSDYSKDAYESQQKLKDYVSKVTKLWTDFAKTSNPTPENCSGPKWPAYTTVNKEYLDINEQSTAGRFADKASVEFWDTLYCEAGVSCIKNN